MVSRLEIEQSGDPLYLAITELIRIVNAVPHAEQESLIEQLSEGRRILWGWFMVDGEVNNGGFNQFFWNDSHLYASLAREAFGLLGATEHLDLLDEAIARSQANRSRLEPYTRRKSLDAFSESYSEAIFDDLDRRYFQLDSDSLVIAYIRSHPDEFAD